MPGSLFNDEIQRPLSSAIAGKLDFNAAFFDLIREFSPNVRPFSMGSLILSFLAEIIL